MLSAGFKPFMEYAGSYALFNYRLEDPEKGLEYSNLRLIRAFEHGLDPSSSEAGFVLVHIAMVRHSGRLVSGALKSLEACSGRNIEVFNLGLSEVTTALKRVNAVMNGEFVAKHRTTSNVFQEMWTKSKPNEYTTFRTFIFGIAKQSMFPNGVVYEGVSDEPMYFRGESGANDSMV
jgi:indoleamine 2,3-dioxygenase